MNGDADDRRLPRPKSPRRAALTAMVGAVVFTAACSGTITPQVANTGNSGDGTSHATASPGTATPKGNPTQLLDEWAGCMRNHGDPGQVDPTVTASKLINISWNPATPGGIYGTNKGGQGNSGPGQFCRSYLAAAQNALRGGQPVPTNSLAMLVKYSDCMHSNGFADFPDPTAGGLSYSLGGEFSPSNPTFRSVSRMCASRTGAHVPGNGPLPPGTIELNGAITAAGV